MHMLVDTNRLVDFLEHNLEAKAAFEQAARVYLPFVVLGEIHSSSINIRHGSRQITYLQLLLNQSGVKILHSSGETIRHYAAIAAMLRKNGTPIPTNDIWIAALALEHDLYLYTRDKHFRHIPSLELL